MGNEPTTDTGTGTTTDQLPTVRTSLPDDEVRERLEAVARRGKLAGYEAKTGDTLFTIRDFGQPFESELRASRTGDTITHTVRLLPKTPTIFIIVLVLTVWPGVWISESFMKTYFPNTLATTYLWWWYILLSAPFVPFAIRSSLKKSRASAHAEAQTIIAGIEKHLDAGDAA